MESFSGKTKDFLVVSLALILTACSINTPPVKNAGSVSGLNSGEKAYGIQAITISYLKKKLDNFINNNKGAKLVKEVNFSRFKHQPTIRAITFNDPVVLRGILDNPDVQSNISSSPVFAAYIDSLIPPPAVPGAANVTAITATSFTAGWSAVVNADSYGLVVNGVETNVGNVLSRNVTGLTPGTDYSFYVKAYTRQTAGADSNTVSLTTIPAAPLATSPSAINETSFTANWNAVAGATGYTVDVAGKGTFNTAGPGSFNVSGLTADTNYSYTVKANNASGSSAASNSVSVKTLPLISTGLVAYYPFNGDANDLSGSGNNGTVNGAVLTADRFGNPGKAYSFDGNDYIIVPNSAALSGFNSLTVAAWFYKPSYSAGLGSVVSKWYQLANQPSGAAQDTYVLSTQNNQVIATTNNSVNGTVNGNFTAGTWVHAAFVHNNLTGGKLYINGVHVANHAATGTIIRSSNALFIGAENNFASIWRFFVGSIDEVRVYNRDLSAAEITAIYNYNP